MAGAESVPNSHKHTWRAEVSPDWALTACRNAAKTLSRKRTTAKARRRALAVLAGAFTDVALPTQPMSLDPDEARSLARSFAQELSTKFESALQDLSVYAQNPEEFLHACDALWVGLVCTMWDEVAPIEAARVQVARIVLSQTTADICADGGMQPHEAWSLIREVLTDPAYPGHAGSLEGLASVGVGQHIALQVIDEALQEQAPS